MFSGCLKIHLFWFGALRFVLSLLMVLQTCRYKRDSERNIHRIEALRKLSDHVIKLANETHPIIKSLEETNHKTKLKFYALFNLQAEVAEIDPIILRQRQVSSNL